ncbi:hypothetical protein [Devosia ginsengisoli]|uniref:Uncharacterized protein n=1 Tax=Devosia ginsengisoli TaxID=400770 RepID=A0A5B8LRS5_9HYPH|nr:hypothetical protein [Devosia ginsengisoli]QDZ10589.1 hypothetical protein FPZ08_07385 [Devosia ginsengisoli]
MFGAALFGVMGATLLIMAARGALSGSINALHRFGGSPVPLNGQASLFWFWFSAHAILGLLCLSLAVYMFWSSRKEKAAEDRFLRHRRALAPPKDNRPEA